MTEISSPKVYTPDSWKRILAYGFDSFFSGLFYLPFLIQVRFFLQSEAIYEIHPFWLISCFSLNFISHWLFLYFLGGTPGKLLFSLRVVNAHDPARSLGLMQALLRVLTDQLKLFFGGAFRVLSWLRHDRTHLSDWVAETRVIQFSPRKDIPQRRIIFSTISFLILIQIGWLRAYKTIQKVEWNGKVLIISTHNSRNAYH